MNIKKIIAGLIVPALLIPTTALPAYAAVRGDISGNGSVDLLDAVEIAKYLVHKRSFTQSELKIADYNNDGKVDLRDAIDIAKYIVKKDPSTLFYDDETVNILKEVVRLVNVERSKKGVSSVTINAKATEAAMIRAREIAQEFSHTRPDGSSCFTVIEEVAPELSPCGENIAAGYSTSEAVMDGWVHSEGHYNNIISSSAKQVGIGYYKADNDTSGYTYYWVQLFIR